MQTSMNFFILMWESLTCLSYRRIFNNQFLKIFHFSVKISKEKLHSKDEKIGRKTIKINPLIDFSDNHKKE